MWKSKKLYRIKELIYPLLKNQLSLDQKQANSLEMLSLIEIYNMSFILGDEVLPKKIVYSVLKNKR